MYAMVSSQVHGKIEFIHLCPATTSLGDKGVRELSKGLIFCVCWPLVSVNIQVSAADHFSRICLPDFGKQIFV